MADTLEFESPPKQSPKKKNKKEGWAPLLNPKQQEAFDSTAKYVLLSGEKGSGKSILGLEALVRHCYENAGAYALVICKTTSTGKEGALHDLENFVLPRWRDGNRQPDFLNGVPNPDAGELIDEGIGLDFTDSRQDAVTKDSIIWIGNMHGGWSKVIFKSIPYAAAVKSRVFGPAPSFVYIDELTNMEGPEYFTYPAAQLGRRRGITGPMQLYSSCNPAGPSNWVYAKWFVESVDEKTDQRDPDFEVIHIPITENIHNLPPGYVERLRQIFKDPIERRRMIDGEWIDRPSGDAIFRPYYMDEVHLLKYENKNQTWKPLRGQPVIVSADVGPVNLSIHFMQRIFITSEKKFYWIIFDELNFVGSYTPYFRSTPKLLKRMDRWNEVCATDFKYVFVTADDAFTQINHDGSYDAAVIEKLGGGRIKFRSCPRGKGSVVERIQMLVDMFLDDSIRISSSCVKTLEMLRSMVSKKVKPGEHEANAGLVPVKSVHLHSFDSLSYGLYYFQLLPGRFPNQSSGKESQSTVFFAGEGR